MRDYLEFLASKRAVVPPVGFDVAPDDFNPKLFPFQRDIARWALRLGKAALFEERGLGKTIQEMEWSMQVQRYTGGKVLIVAPLAVTFQHLEEATKFGYSLKYCETQSDIGDANIVITNYERLDAFQVDTFQGVVLDESSILKAFNGRTKRAIINACKTVPFKLAASATPAPNDHLELGNHAEFLDIMPSNEMIARWFINNSKKAGDYRLKKHAARDFWRWLTSWAVCISHPRDLGEEYDLPGYDLPPLRLHEHIVAFSQATIERTFESGRLLPDSKPSSTQLHQVKRESIEARLTEAVGIMGGLSADESAILWCDTNDEADALMSAFPDAIEVRGSHTAQRKFTSLKAFTTGEAKRIITKPDIAGMGLNWQHCSNQLFYGLSYSFEKFYQALGRSYRYGQTREVHAHLIISESEMGVLETLKRKQGDFAEMQGEMNRAMREHGLFRDNARRALTSSLGNQTIVLPVWLQERKVAS